MAFDAGEVTGKLQLDARNFLKALKASNAALKKTGKAAKEAGGGFKTFAEKLAVVRDLMLVLPGIINAVLAPLKGLFNFLKDSSVAAAEFQDQVRGLAVALALKGIPNVKDFTKELEDFASKIQDSTAFSDSLVLSIGKTLVNFGVARKDLKKYIKVIIDFSAATGREANQAAINFAKTMTGLRGELNEQLPGLDKVTEAQLRLGGAFELGAVLFKEFSEQVANTTKGLRSQLVNAFVDLQKAVGSAINPVLDVLTKVAIGVVKTTTATVKGSQGAITAEFRKVVDSVLNVLSSLVDKALDIPVLIAGAKQFVAEVVSSILTGSVDVDIAIKGLLIGIKEGVRDLLLAFNEIPLVDLNDKIVTINGELAQSVSSLKDMKDNVEAIKAPYRETAEKAKETAKAAEETAKAIRDGKMQTEGLGLAYKRANGFINQAREGLKDMSDKTREVTLATTGYGQALTKRLAQVREITGLTDEVLRPAVDAVTDSTNRAADATNRLKNEAIGAAAAFGSAAAASSSIGVSAGGSRRKGGSAGLDLSTAFSAINALGTARNAINRGGGIFQRFQRQSARAVANQIAAVAQSQVDLAFSEFTSGLLSELSSLGILDPTQRASFIDERIAEAIRLGVLPPKNAVGTAGLGGFGGTF